MEEMFVVKRDGTKQRFSVDKIRNRLEQLCHGLDKKVRDKSMLSYHVLLPLTSSHLRHRLLLCPLTKHHFLFSDVVG